MKLAAYAILLSALTVPTAASADEALATTLIETIRLCWSPPADMTSKPRVKFTLDRNGALVGDPEVIDPSGDMAETSAVRAILRCAPFTAAAQYLDADETPVTVNFTMDESAAQP